MFPFARYGDVFKQMTEESRVCDLRSTTPTSGRGPLRGSEVTDSEKITLLSRLTYHELLRVYSTLKPLEGEPAVLPSSKLIEGELVVLPSSKLKVIEAIMRESSMAKAASREKISNK